jgi:tetratricopeptide (TPR) repeat protein
VTPFHFHPQVASSLNNLGVVLEAMGRYDEALDALNQCHALQLQLLAADHPDVAATLNNLGKVLHRTAQHDDALAMLRHALRIRERSFGPSHPKVRERDGKAPMFLISVGSWRQGGWFMYLWHGGSLVAASSLSKAIHRRDEGGIGGSGIGMPEFGWKLTKSWWICLTAADELAKLSLRYASSALSRQLTRVLLEGSVEYATSSGGVPLIPGGSRTR